VPVYFLQHLPVLAKRILCNSVPMTVHSAENPAYMGLLHSNPLQLLSAILCSFTLNEVDEDENIFRQILFTHEVSFYSNDPIITAPQNK
jgi:hypothetical protein